MIPATSPQKRQRPNLKHGFYTLKRAVAVLGSRALPTKRTALGRALAEWRASLLVDLGGMDTVSTQQLALVEQSPRELGSRNPPTSQLGVRAEAAQTVPGRAAAA